MHSCCQNFLGRLGSIYSYDERYFARSYFSNSKNREEKNFLKNTLDYLNENKHIYSKYITTVKEARNNGLNENVLINKTI